jgi:hypothetical protein
MKIDDRPQGGRGENAMRQLSRWIFLWLLLTGATGPALAAQAKEEPSPQIYEARYDIRFMDVHAAEALAWDQCGEAIKEHCRVTALGVGGDSKRKAYLEVRGDSATHERVAKALAKADAMPRTQAFHILLLAGSRKAASTPQDLPASAQKAIADIRDFLPYKSYEVLDSAWMRATDVAEARLAGRPGNEYQAILRFHPTGVDGKELFLDTFRLVQMPRWTPQPPSKEEEGKPAVAPPAATNLLQTSFGVKVGETVVVGTSKVDGADEALIVLLTAVP